MVNEMYNFKTALTDMVEKLARSSGRPEDVKEVCQTAVRCMSQEHLMLALKFDRISAVSDLVLGITDMRLDGAAIPKKGVQLKVEIVTRHQGGLMGGHRYFAPRWTNVAKAAGDDVSWGDEAVRFKRFYLPHGAELSMAILFTVKNTRSLMSVGHATVLLHEVEWERTEGGSITSPILSVPLETQHLPFGMRIFAPSDHTATFHAKLHIENLNPDIAPTPEDAWELLLRNSTVLRITGNGPQGRDITSSRASRPTRSRLTNATVEKSDSLEARVRSLEHAASTINQTLQQLTARHGQSAPAAAAAADDPSSQEAAANTTYLVVV